MVRRSGALAALAMYSEDRAALALFRDASHVRSCKQWRASNGTTDSLCGVAVAVPRAVVATACMN